jgi:hypothetical protein
MINMYKETTSQNQVVTQTVDPSFPVYKAWCIVYVGAVA